MTTRRDALGAFLLLGTAPQIRSQSRPLGPAKHLGYLGLESDPKTPRTERAFYIAMRTKGWILGQNLVPEPAYADWRAERLAGLAEELVRKRVDVILSSGTKPTIAAARATRTIPIVFFDVPFPVEQGLVDSLSRPGRNVTGQALSVGLELHTKAWDLLRQIVPTAKRLSFIVPADDLETVSGGSFDTRPGIASIVKRLGFEVRYHFARSPQDLDTALRDIAAWPAQAIAATGLQVAEARRHLAEVALRSRLPTVFFNRTNVEAGGLLSYGVSRSEYAIMTTRTADVIDRIFRGSPSAEIPVIQPSRFEFVVNLTTAKALGLTIPQAVLLRADEVLQ